MPASILLLVSTWIPALRPPRTDVCLKLMSACVADGTSVVVVGSASCTDSFIVAPLMSAHEADHENRPSAVEGYAFCALKCLHLLRLTVLCHIC